MPVFGIWNNTVIPTAPASTGVNQTQSYMPSSTSTLPGAAATYYDAATGGIPSVPNPAQSALDAINAAITNMSSAQNLANQINQFNQGQLTSQITSLYPQFTSNTNQIGANLSDWAAGRVSRSTTNALAQAMAERGVRGGFGVDSPAANAALMRALGQTSEGLQSQALTGQTQLLSSLPRAPLTDMTQFMVKPSDIYNAQLMQNLYNAAPIPSQAYRLAMNNARAGARAGSQAGGNSDIMAMLQNLINRGRGTDTTAAATSPYTSGTSYAPYTPNGVGRTTMDDLYNFYDYSGIEPEMAMEAGVGPFGDYDVFNNYSSAPDFYSEMFE